MIKTCEPTAGNSQNARLEKNEGSLTRYRNCKDKGSMNLLQLMLKYQFGINVL